MRVWRVGSSDRSVTLVLALRSGLSFYRVTAMPRSFPSNASSESFTFLASPAILSEATARYRTESSMEYITGYRDDSRRII